MTEATTSSAKAPQLNPLQRAWLREIGMEKIWLRQDEPKPAGAGVQADAAAASADAAARVSQRRGAAGTEVGASAGAAMAAQAGADTQAGIGARLGGAHAAAAVQAGAATAGVSGAPASAQDPAASAEPASAPAAAARPPIVAPRPAKPAAPGARPGKEAAPTQPPPTAESLAMLDMPALHERVIECTACGLCRGRRQAVFGMGPEQARWLVVGEAPGEQEDRQGLPFVGRSGQLLDAMLASVGMSRERDVYIANVIKCRPPGNRNPKPEEIAACRPYLMRQIALLKPERILVLGRFAAQTLLETDAAIGSLRGRVHALKTEHGEIPMVVSYHPAYLLRSPAEKARAWQDLRLAANLVQS